jgi:hypothetical protein
VSEIDTLEGLVDSMVALSSYPHIAVYYPSNACFAHYDIILAVYSDASKLTSRVLFGYQFKERKIIPTNEGECGDVSFPYSWIGC